MAAVRTIAVTNQKGGVGKTTTVANLGAALARRRINTCLIDLDPQAHLTMHFGIDRAALPLSIYDVIIGRVPLGRAAILAEPNLTVVPSVIGLAGAEVELAGQVGREQILRDRIQAQNLPYELILIDCPPSLGLLTLNALTAAEEVYIPLQPHFLALQGLGGLLETVSLVRKRINPDLTVGGLILCMYESGTRLAAEVTEDVRRFFDAARGGASPWSSARVFQTQIRRNIKLAECPSHGTTIFRYEPSSHGAADYAALADEFVALFASQGEPFATAEAPQANLAEAASGPDAGVYVTTARQAAPPEAAGPAEPDSRPADQERAGDESPAAGAGS